ncbi:MAG: glycosyltransferase family 39 protein [Candidatus Limnocylindria bacterium]
MIVTHLLRLASPAIGSGAIGAGLLLLLAGLVPWVPWLEGVADPAAGPARAPHVAGGLVLLAFGAALLGRFPLPRTSAALVAGAAAVPAGTGLLLLLAFGHQLLTPGLASPELARLLLVASAAGVVLAPAVMVVVLAESHDPPPTAPRRRHQRWWLFAILAAFAIVVVLGIARQAPFGWDEAVYALMPRHWLVGTPETGWGPHRPLALSALGVLPLQAGSQEWLFRLVGLAFGLGMVAAAWILARSMGGSAAGLLAAAGVAASPTIAHDAGLFLNDVPAAALLLGAVAVLWRAVERGGPVSWSLLWLAPLLAGAFYLRYGSLIPIAGLAAASLLVWPSRLAAAWPKLLATAGLLVALLLPHAAFATLETGSPLGIVLQGQANAASEALGGGLAAYLDWLPAPLAGVVPGTLVILGLAGAAFWLAAAGRGGPGDAHRRGLALLVATALLQVLGLGLAIHAEMRYVAFAVALLLVAGCLVLAEAARRRGRIGGLALSAAAAGLAVSLVVNAWLVPDMAAGRIRDFGWERTLALRIDELATGSCSVLVASVPQTTWYSGCASYSFGDARHADRDALLTGDDRFLVVRADGAGQPVAEVMSEYLARVEAQPLLAVADGRGRPAAWLYRFRERASGLRSCPPGPPASGPVSRPGCSGEPSAG